MNIEYLTLAVYFAFLLVLGAVFARFNKNLSDFSRGGSRLTWWMVGMSNLMAGISAFTFTGNGSSAFEAGPSMLVIYFANVLGHACGWLYLAHRYRQTRAYTTADIKRERFGVGAEQFGAWMGLFLGPIAAAIQLWALAVFVSAVFGFSITLTIVVIGVITVFYSSSGGAWAVVATDFVQGVILFGITVLIAGLAYQAIGGWEGFAAAWAEPRVAADFTFFKEPGRFSGDRYTWQWAGVIFVMQFMAQINLGAAGRYLSVKDGREARRAALFSMMLMAFGTAVWFFPPMVARMIYETQVLESGIKDPATTAYAVVAKNLLPNGLMGVLIAAMFAATMSSMDSGLNAQTSTLVRNVLPRLRSALGLSPLREEGQLRLCRTVSVVLGAVIITYALLLSVQEKIMLFDAYLTINSVIGVPMGLPLLAGLIFRRLPAWSYFVIIAGALLPSIYSLVQQSLGGEAWTIQQRSFWVLVYGSGATVLVLCLERLSTEASRERVRGFFQKMDTPVDFDREIGGANDETQAVLLGRSVAVMGGLMFGFLLVPNPAAGRWQIVMLAGSTLLVGAGLWIYGARKNRSSG
jgi:Na+/proline symporter